VRRGYWTGFFMGGLIGMLAVKAYGDQLMDLMYSKLEGRSGDIANSPQEGTETVYRPRQRYRYRRTW
jgi:hypothetical protein